jgi:Inosine-uridine nucleoside N-ribohydrolase
VGNRASEFVCALMSYPEVPIPAAGLVVYDALAAAALIEPEILRGRELYVDVETKGELTAGQTVVDVDNLLGRAPNALVGFEADRAAFVRLVERTVRFYQ